MNKRGFSPVTLIFWCIVFVILYALALAPILSAQGATAVANGQYTGIERLFYENLNLVVVTLFFIFIAAYGVYSQQ